MRALTKDHDEWTVGEWIKIPAPRSSLRRRTLSRLRLWRQFVVDWLTPLACVLLLAGCHDPEGYYVDGVVDALGCVDEISDPKAHADDVFQCVLKRAESERKYDRAADMIATVILSDIADDLKRLSESATATALPYTGQEINGPTREVP